MIRDPFGTTVSLHHQGLTDPTRFRLTVRGESTTIRSNGGEHYDLQNTGHIYLTRAQLRVLRDQLTSAIESDPAQVAVVGWGT